MNKIYKNKIYDYADISRKSALMNRRNFRKYIPRNIERRTFLELFNSIFMEEH